MIEPTVMGNHLKLRAQPKELAASPSFWVKVACQVDDGPPQYLADAATLGRCGLLVVVS